MHAWKHQWKGRCEEIYNCSTRFPKPAFIWNIEKKKKWGTALWICSVSSQKKKNCGVISLEGQTVNLVHSTKWSWKNTLEIWYLSPVVFLKNKEIKEQLNYLMKLFLSKQLIGSTTNASTTFSSLVCGLRWRSPPLQLGFLDCVGYICLCVCVCVSCGLLVFVCLCLETIIRFTLGLTWVHIHLFVLQVSMAWSVQQVRNTYQKWNPLW